MPFYNTYTYLFTGRRIPIVKYLILTSDDDEIFYDLSDINKIVSDYAAVHLQMHGSGINTGR
jgi:hypothetical protein